ncbi:MAG: hypothetical protein EXX96DRAFT_553265, partial [Benjaminiella poitrasii]
MSIHIHLLLSSFESVFILVVAFDSCKASGPVPYLKPDCCKSPGQFSPASVLITPILSRSLPNFGVSALSLHKI